VAGRGQQARDYAGNAIHYHRSHAVTSGHGHFDLANMVGQYHVVVYRHLNLLATRPQRGQRFHGLDTHVVAPGCRRHRGQKTVVGWHNSFVVSVAVTDVVLIPACTKVPTGTPHVIVSELAHVPETGHTTLVCPVALVVFVKHREVTVGAIVQPQYCVSFAENHVTVVGH